MTQPIVETDRLTLRRIHTGDAAFLLVLLNDPAFLQFVGDKGVRTLADAETYVRTGPIESYARFGFGLLLVTLRDDGAPIGICGLLQRDMLDAPDLGFALLPEFRRNGYAAEAAAAVLEWGGAQRGIHRILAIVQPENARSIELLHRLGFGAGQPAAPAPLVPGAAPVILLARQR